jgi:hypothetical protein
MEFKSQSVHSYLQQNADRVTDTGESSAKPLLLAVKGVFLSAVVVQRVIAILWNQPLWANKRLL